MKILYGVTGCGLGHTMRARAVTEHLLSRGHTVRIAASGRAVDILRRHGLDVVAIDGMAMRFADGEARRARSALALLRQAPRAIRRNASVAWHHVLDFDPETLITDFDTFVPAVGAVLRRPVISLDHQHVLDRFRHPATVTEKVSAFALARALVTAKTPRCDHYIVTSFFFPEPRYQGTSLVGPIVRREIEQAVPTEDEHILVYQTTSGDPRLLPALLAVPNARFRVYGLGREETIGNVELRGFDETRFVVDLASARAVVANGGYTTLSEAVVLGKPVLSIPVRGQSEQELNAAWLEVLGLGTRAERIDPHALRAFVDRLDDYRGGRVLSGTRDATTALDRALAEAA
jgi:uncharacterized protein (TIGR00661 family)